MGIALGANTIADLKLGTSQVDKVYLGSNVVWQKSAPVAIKALKFSSSGAQTLGLNTSVLGSITPSFEYSLDDGSTWTAWTVSNPISFGSGTDLYVRGTNTKLATTGNNFTQFVFSTASPVACSGNIMHLFDHTQDLTAFPATAGGDSSDRGVKEIFQNCAVLNSAPELPATVLAAYCYWHAFEGCSALASAPELPATTLTEQCYYAMFKDCTALASLPYLGDVSLVASICYGEMFYGCSNIKMSRYQVDDYQNRYPLASYTISLSGIADNMFYGTGGAWGGTPTQQTLYTSNTIVGVQ